MKKKLLTILPIILACPLAFKGASIAVHAMQEDKPHPMGQEDIAIDYHTFGDEEIDPERPYDDSKKYDYSSYSFVNKHGSFTNSSGAYTSNSNDSLAVCDGVAFPYGSFEVSMTGASNSADQGIIFAVSDSNKESYWEGDGISYYFFFLGRTGQLSLGKTTNGLWATKLETSVGAVSPTATYKMKVVMKSNLMIFYFNDEIKFYLKDKEFLTGTKWGLRAGSSGTKFTVTNITNDYIVE